MACWSLRSRGRSPRAPRDRPPTRPPLSGGRRRPEPPLPRPAPPRPTGPSRPPGRSGASRPRLGMLAVPVEGAGEALAQLDRGPPAGRLPQLRGVDELAVDLAVGVAAAQILGLDL